MVAGVLTAGVAIGGFASGVAAVLGRLVDGIATGLAAAVTAFKTTLAVEIIVDWFK